MMHQQRRAIPTRDDFDAQLDALHELDSIDASLRWLDQGAVERFLLGLRRAELVRQINAWTARFAPDREDVEGHIVHA